MTTIINAITAEGKKDITVKCLASETKPTGDDISMGSLCLEMNAETHELKAYFYGENGWIEIGGNANE